MLLSLHQFSAPASLAFNLKQTNKASVAHTAVNVLFMVEKYQTRILHRLLSIELVMASERAYMITQASELDQWKKMAHSAESPVLLHHVDNRVCACDLPGEEMAPGCTMGRKEAFRGSMMLWEVFLMEPWLLDFTWISRDFDTYCLPRRCCRPSTPLHGLIAVSSHCKKHSGMG